MRSAPLYTDDAVFITPGGVGRGEEIRAAFTSITCNVPNADWDLTPI